MPQTTVISRRELKRQTALVFQGKTLNVMLCNVGATGFTEESTVANWQTVEHSGGGYVRFTQVVGTSAYNGTSGKEEVPEIEAAFTSTSAINYDTVAVYFTGETYLHSLITEDPNIVLANGQTQTYGILLTQNK